MTMANTRISPDDELIKYIGLYNPRPVILHGYVLPFLILYIVVGWNWLFVYDWDEYFEIGLIIFSVIGSIQVLTCLFCHWSVHVRCFLTCKKEAWPELATVAKVVPLPNNGSAELINLQHTKGSDGSPAIWLTFQRSKYVWDGGERKQFLALHYPVDRMLQHYAEWRGYATDQQLAEAVQTYGPNNLMMNVPEFMELFKERATAPFFVFQVFCVFLWCLDQYWHYAVFTLFMLVVFEGTLVQQQLRNMDEIRKMGNRPFGIQVYRNSKWRSLQSSELLPGDIVSVSRGNTEQTVPCDMLLLRGPAVLDESMLTGESIPQMKESLDGLDWSRPLDIAADGKLHVLFGGTKLVQHTPPQKTHASHLKAPDNGVICYVLRTSFGSAQGRLLRTILYSVSRVTANNRETFVFILFLLVFAVAAAGYVWVKGIEDPTRNRYKLFLECTLILTSVVPPELPIELSLAVNTSLLSLSRLLVYCTEPFRIPFAGKIDVCCFDKTGTLTSDDLIVEGIAGLDGTSKVIPAIDAPLQTIQVVAVCHSLVNLDDGLLGDPQEKATLAAIDWTLTKTSSVVPKKGKSSNGLKILQRFHFTSQLKRMSVIASYSQLGLSDSSYMVAVKGAPETIRGMLTEVPRNYDQVHLELSRRGARVLTLARKDFGTLSHHQVKDLTRQKVECNLTFQGFIIISCPMKRHSLEVIKEVQASSHITVMITGDNPLTACHVAKQLHFTRGKQILILQKLHSRSTNGSSGMEEEEEEANWVWQSIDQTVQLPGLPQMAPKDMKKNFFLAYDFCVTGEGLSLLRSRYPIFFEALLPHVRVFARVAPKQKEHVITSYKALGFTTLMCGDGTNDVGALKHAHCGVAILSNAPDRPPSKKKVEEAPAMSAAATEKFEAAKKLARKMDKRSPGAAAAAINSTGGGGPPGGGGGLNQRLTAQQIQQQKAAQQLQKLLAELEEEQQQMVKLGDASIAAPFTSKLSSIQCVLHIIKQGRCTLVTTLQMFKILALNALILAYSQSVLYVDGIKLSDYQATLQGLLLAACFLFISRAKPLHTLSRQRPPPTIFNPYTVLTVLLQFSVHFTCLCVVVHQANILEPSRTKSVDLEKSFEPSLLNSAVYIISMTLQISTFAINYRGRPYMESLREHRALLYTLFCSGGFVLALAMGVIPEFARQFEIVDFPSQFRITLLQVLLADFSMSFIVDRVCMFLFGEGQLPAALRQ